MKFFAIVFFVGSAVASAALSPSAVVPSPDGKILYIACATDSRVLVFDVASGKVARSVKVLPNPTGLCVSADGKRLFVTCARGCVVDTARNEVVEELPVGHTAMAPVLSPDGNTLFVCNRFDNDVSVFDLATRTELRRIPVRREPVAAAVSPDGKWLLVANHLPAGRADAEHVGAVVSVIDVARGMVVDDLWLPRGSGSLNDLRISPDGKFAAVTHVLARFWLPTTKVDIGLINANTLTVIALDCMEVVNTVMLDSRERGGANPWGVAWSADSKTLIVAHAGTHEVSVIDFPALHTKLTNLTPAPLKVVIPYGSPARAVADVSNDPSFLTGLSRRQPLGEGDLGPRSVAVVGRRAFAANYFSDTLSVIHLDGSSVKTIPLGPKQRMTSVRLGELYFHDGRICRQGWQSCASCHPGDARHDGLNWDLPNDGTGNPKNTKSLLFVHRTPPVMSLGQRETAESAVRTGIEKILFTTQPSRIAEAMDAYLKSRKPVPSPYLVNGSLSPSARRGEKLFFSKETGCARCHPRPLFTDLKSHDVGTRGPPDRDTDTFDTPSLIELWRTAPYLHDGSVVTLHDLLVFANEHDCHGKTSHLSADEIRDLCAYLLSL